MVGPHSVPRPTEAGQGDVRGVCAHTCTRTLRAPAHVDVQTRTDTCTPVRTGTSLAHTWVHTCTALACRRKHTHTRTRAPVVTRACAYRCTHVHTPSTHINRHSHTHVPVGEHACTYMDEHMHTHSCAHTCAHPGTPPPQFPPFQHPPKPPPSSRAAPSAPQGPGSPRPLPPCTSRAPALSPRLYIPPLWTCTPVPGTVPCHPPHADPAKPAPPGDPGDAPTGTSASGSEGLGGERARPAGCASPAPRSPSPGRRVGGWQLVAIY